MGILKIENSQIKINDVNGNDRFDPKEDSVILPKDSKSSREKYASFKAVLGIKALTELGSLYHGVKSYKYVQLAKQIFHKCQPKWSKCKLNWRDFTYYAWKAENHARRAGILEKATPGIYKELKKGVLFFLNQAEAITKESDATTFEVMTFLDRHHNSPFRNVPGIENDEEVLERVEKIQKKLVDQGVKTVLLETDGIISGKIKCSKKEIPEGFGFYRNRKFLNLKDCDGEYVATMVAAIHSLERLSGAKHIVKESGELDNEGGAYEKELATAEKRLQKWCPPGWRKLTLPMFMSAGVGKSTTMGQYVKGTNDVGGMVITGTTKGQFVEGMRDVGVKVITGTSKGQAVKGGSTKGQVKNKTSEEPPKKVEDKD